MLIAQTSTTTSYSCIEEDVDEGKQIKFPCDPEDDSISELMLVKAIFLDDSICQDFHVYEVLLHTAMNHEGRES